MYGGEEREAYRRNKVRVPEGKERARLRREGNGEGFYEEEIWLKGRRVREERGVRGTRKERYIGGIRTGFGKGREERGKKGEGLRTKRGHD